MKVDVSEFSKISARCLDYLDEIFEMKMRKKWVENGKRVTSDHQQPSREESTSITKLDDSSTTPKQQGNH